MDPRDITCLLDVSLYLFPQVPQSLSHFILPCTEVTSLQTILLKLLLTMLTQHDSKKAEALTKEKEETADRVLGSTINFHNVPFYSCLFAANFGSMRAEEKILLLLH